MCYRHSAFYGLWEMEEATTKASEDDTKTSLEKKVKMYCGNMQVTQK